MVLCDGDVDMLIVGELGEVIVVIGKVCIMVVWDVDMLFEFGELVDCVVRVDEVLLFVVIVVGVVLVCDDNWIVLLDGVGVLLCYVVIN